MTIPEMGHVIASRYNIHIVYISHQLSLSMLPLRSYPIVQNPKVLVTVFVGNTHFIRIELKPDCPFSPINIYGSRFRNNFNARLGDMFGEQLQ